MMNVLDRNQTVTDSKDMLAKLLASENITVVRANLQTASFDTVNRVLRLPQWQNLTPEVEEMLIGHEVGHALYTTNDYMEECRNDNALMGYMNVIEDVRIEKKVKQKYPGLRKTFTQAYRKLQEDDFFEVKTRDLSKLLFIDRINLYFKAGFTCGVKFSAAEAEMVKRVAACDSIHDVYNLAAELLDYTRQELKEEQEEVQKMLAQAKTDEDDQTEEEESFFDDEGDDWDDYEENDSDGESEESDSFSEDSAEGERGSAGFGKTAGRTDWEEESAVQDQAESVTERALRKNLSDLADTDREYINVEFDGKKAFCYNPIVSSKEILSLVGSEFIDHDNDNWNTFYNSVNRDINYLVKEFEMRKQATRYKRATRAKTGDLAVNKLFAYKLTDDLFKRITVLPDGKNHGFMMLLDWSGSMHENMDDTLKQCLTIAMFMRRIQVPFRVYGFTDQFGRYSEDASEHYTQLRAHEAQRRDSSKPNFSMNKFYLLDFLNDRQSQSEFNQMAKMLLSSPWRYSRHLSLGGTPLYEAMWFIADHVGDFIKQNSIEKFSFITLTDGDGHPLYPNFQTRTRVQVPIGIDGMTRPKLVDNAISMVDPKTRKTYKVDMGRYQNNMKEVMQQILRDRYGARLIGFHICRNTARDVGYFFNGNCTEEPYSNARDKLFAEVRTELRRNGFSSSDKFGDDKTFILRADKMGIETKELSIDSTKNAGSIARQFSKQLGGNRASKIMLNQFMELVA